MSKEFGQKGRNTYHMLIIDDKDFPQEVRGLSSRGGVMSNDPLSIIPPKTNKQIRKNFDLKKNIYIFPCYRW